jgi:DamX protein
MENTKQPASPDESNAAVLTLAERVAALERTLAQQDAGSQAAEGKAGQDGPVQQAELSAELERHRDQLRDYEKALVERIADVDDDRRATASRLQRAWQTQREEIDDRLRRHAGLMSGLLLLFALIVAVALFLVYQQAATGQRQIAEEVAEMQGRLDGASAADESVQQIRAELSRLGEQVNEDVAGMQRRLDGVSATGETVKQVREELTRLSREMEKEAGASVAQRGPGEEPSAVQMAEAQDAAQEAAREVAREAVADERKSREAAESRVADEIGRLEAEQKRLVKQLAALRAALGTAQAGPAAEQVKAAAEAAASPEQTPDPEIRPPAAQPDGTARGSLAEAATEEATEGAGDAPADAGPGSDGLGTGETVAASEGSYALQLIGFYNPDSLARFAAREGLPERVYYLRQTYRGRPWYALVHSLHDGYASAVAELGELPADLVALNPWIRPVPAGTELRVLETGPGR